MSEFLSLAFELAKAWGPLWVLVGWLLWRDWQRDKILFDLLREQTAVKIRLVRALDALRTAVERA